MCGIVGIYGCMDSAGRVEEATRRMLASIRHRGPDETGIYLDADIALGSARLSILDIRGGQQPIANEDGRVWVVYNGEIFNYKALREDLLARGHRFSTATDTEVLVHLYEEFGPDFLPLLNGQFAFALWDSCERLLLLARDRLGIRPLYTAHTSRGFVFGSEIKALLSSGMVEARLDSLGIDQAFTFWSTLSPWTAFRNVIDLPPGHRQVITGGRVHDPEPYWHITFPEAAALKQAVSRDAVEDLADELADLLIDATRLRLHADVPVGAYLSGGLDSSTTTAIILRYANTHLDTFSIAFDDVAFDETAHQQRVAAYLGTDHHALRVSHADVGRVFPDVVWHAEMPLLRTSPAPMFLLSEQVSAQDYKVVLTGEGADEILGGYNIFKEAKVRRFWARQPDSQLRPQLFKRLYPYVAALGSTGEANLFAFFSQGLEQTDARDYSHAIRWRNTSRTKRFFGDRLRREIAADYNNSFANTAVDDVTYPPEFDRWDPLCQAQFLELSIFLCQYLLSGQGDRMTMAHSVEGRYPFLDHRLVEFCSTLPPHVKLRGLQEKLLLRRVAERWLPDDIAQRPKQAYRAPIHRSFFGEAAPPYIAELLSAAQLEAAGLFNPAAVGQLVRKVERGLPIGETDDMALAGIISCQLLYHLFVRDFQAPEPVALIDKVIHNGVGVQALSP